MPFTVANGHQYGYLAYYLPKYNTQYCIINIIMVIIKLDLCFYKSITYIASYSYLSRKIIKLA